MSLCFSVVLSGLVRRQAGVMRAIQSISFQPTIVPRAVYRSCFRIF